MFRYVVENRSVCRGRVRYVPVHPNRRWDLLVRVGADTIFLIGVHSTPEARKIYSIRSYRTETAAHCPNRVYPLDRIDSGRPPGTLLSVPFGVGPLRAADRTRPVHAITTGPSNPNACRSIVHAGLSERIASPISRIVIYGNWQTNHSRQQWPTSTSNGTPESPLPVRVQLMER